MMSSILNLSVLCKTSSKYSLCASYTSCLESPQTRTSFMFAKYLTTQILSCIGYHSLSKYHSINSFTQLSASGLHVALMYGLILQGHFARFLEIMYINCFLVKCVNSSIPINVYAAPWCVSKSFSYSRCVNFIEAIEPSFNDFGKTHICLVSVATHPNPLYILLDLSHGQSLATIHGIVRLKIIPLKKPSLNHLVGSRRRANVFPTHAQLQDITISAGEASTFSWYQGCGFIIVAILFLWFF